MDPIHWNLKGLGNKWKWHKKMDIGKHFLNYMLIWRLSCFSPYSVYLFICNSLSFMMITEQYSSVGNIHVFFSDIDISLIWKMNKVWRSFRCRKRNFIGSFPKTDHKSRSGGGLHQRRRREPQVGIERCKQKSCRLNIQTIFVLANVT